MKLVIKGTLPGLNDYINAERANKHAAAQMKNRYQSVIMTYIKKCLGNWKPKTPVWMHYTWYEKDRRRDKDNVVFARKFIQDALVKVGTLPNDGWNEVEGFDDLVLVDKESPRVEVEVVEYLPTKETYQSLIDAFQINEFSGFREYESLRQEYESLRQEYESLRYTFNVEAAKKGTEHGDMEQTQPKQPL